MSIICMDVGTTRCKIACLSSDGVMLCHTSFQHYAQLSDNFIDCEHIFCCLSPKIKQMLLEHPDVSAITATSFGETLVFVGSDGKALAPSLLYFDRRSQKQADILKSNIDCKSFYLVTGHHFGAGSPLSKLLWCAEQQPEVLKKANTVLFVADYILFRLGAEPFISQSFARRSHWYKDQGSQLWMDVLTVSGLSEFPFPPACPAGKCVGFLSEKYANGYSNRPALLAGGHDQTFATLGAGAFRSGDTVYGMGTSDSLNILLSELILNDSWYLNGYDCEKFFNTENYLTFAHIPSGGKSLTWAYNCLFCSHKPFCWDECEHEISIAVQRRNDVLFLPLINGAGTPHSQIRHGCFFGLSSETDTYDMLTAVLEGVAFEMLLNRSLLAQSGIVPARIFVSGGGARSAFWLQLRSDIWQEPFQVCKFNDTGLFGLYAVAAAAQGGKPSLGEAVSTANPVAYTVVPNPENAQFYSHKFGIYQELRKKMTDFKGEKL